MGKNQPLKTQSEERKDNVSNQIGIIELNSQEKAPAIGISLR